MGINGGAGNPEIGIPIAAQQTLRGLVGSDRIFSHGVSIDNQSGIVVESNQFGAWLEVCSDFIRLLGATQSQKERQAEYPGKDPALSLHITMIVSVNNVMI